MACQIIELYPVGMDFDQRIYGLQQVLMEKILGLIWITKYLAKNSVMGQLTWMEAYDFLLLSYIQLIQSSNQDCVFI